MGGNNDGLWMDSSMDRRVVGSIKALNEGQLFVFLHLGSTSSCNFKVEMCFLSPSFGNWGPVE